MHVTYSPFLCTKRAGSAKAKPPWCCVIKRVVIFFQAQTYKQPQEKPYFVVILIYIYIEREREDRKGFVSISARSLPYVVYQKQVPLSSLCKQVVDRICHCLFAAKIPGPVKTTAASFHKYPVVGLLFC
jgi:hypothetical protein